MKLTVRFSLFSTALTLLLLVLKVFGIFGYSWWWVLLPWGIETVVALIFAAVSAWLMKSMWAREEEWIDEDF